MMVSSYREWFLGEFLVIAGLIGVQAIMAFYMVFVNRILSLGFNLLFFVVFATLTASVFLLPMAVTLEKKKWPKRLSPTLVIQSVLIAFGGVALYQTFMGLGVNKTSPAIASAIPNLAPGFIFIISAIVGFERVNMRCKYSISKILGTLLCLSGALVMSFLQSPSDSPTLRVVSHKSTLLSKAAGLNIVTEWIIGCMYLLAAVLMLSCSTVLQAAAMHECPTPISLSAVTFFLGSVLTALVQIIKEGKLDAGSPVFSLTSIIGIVLLGGFINSFCLTFQTWCIGKRGPVLVSMFSPMQTVCSAFLSATVLGQLMGLGSVTGMLLMFAGLYIVLWAKKKEACNMVDADGHTRRIEDIEEPLLS